MNTRKPVDAQAILLMLVLCTVWGFQQVALKLAAPDIAPILQIGLRSGMAAVLVGLLVWARGERFGLRDGTLWPGVAVGTLFALEYLLVGQGLHHTSAGHIAVFLYTAPIFAALGLHCTVPAERLQPLQWAGIGLAFGGVAWAFLGMGGMATPGAEGRNMLLGDLMGLLAAVCWGATTVTVRCTRLSNAPTTQTVLYQLVGACVLLVLAAVATGQTRFNPTPTAWAVMAFQVLVMSFASLLVWFWLLRKYLASQLGVFSFMTPLFGIAFGVWLLHEPLEPSFVRGAGLVLLGIVLVSGHKWVAGVLAGWGRRMG
jgi:drug/metabolite transporter (DMT)-like permease